ncbi:MAG: hypothetical protein Kow0088_26330 [Anaerolineales bacterium]
MSENVKVISFLGIGNYSPTCYVWKGREVQTEFFTEAVAHFIKPSKMMICLTPTASKGDKSANWQKLSRRLESAHIHFEPLPIPEGHAESDLWDIFNALTNAVDEGENLVFDITHSFRSLPFLSFLAIAYLKAAKNVKVQNVLYGAWEARDTSTNRSPVFDLTPFVSLLDWLTATEQFIQTGNARQLVQLISSDQHEKDRQIKAVARVLDKVSQAAFLCQPFTLMKVVQELSPTLQEAEEGISKTVPPFYQLRQQIVDEFELFRADFPNDPQRVLQSEYQLVRWYIEKNQLIQAMSLAREFLVDGVQYKFTQSLSPDSFARGLRGDFERAVSGQPKIGGQNQEGSGRFTVDDLNEYGKKIYNNENDKWKERDLIKQAWAELESVRNGMDHAEHQKSPIPIQTLQKKIKKDILPALEKLAEVWGLSEIPQASNLEPFPYEENGNQSGE